MSTDTGLELGPKSLSSSIGDFAGEGRVLHTGAEFEKIQGKTGFAWSWNGAAALAGPLWGAFRGLWGFFWTFLVLELFALVQLGRGLWGDLGADQMARFEKLAANIEKRKAAGRGPRRQEAIRPAPMPRSRSQATLKKGGGQGASPCRSSCRPKRSPSCWPAWRLLIVIKIIEGFYGNIAYEKQYLRWRANPKTASGRQ